MAPTRIYHLVYKVTGTGKLTNGKCKHPTINSPFWIKETRMQSSAQSDDFHVISSKLNTLVEYYYRPFLQHHIRFIANTTWPHNFSKIISVSTRSIGSKQREKHPIKLKS